MVQAGGAGPRDESLFDVMTGFTVEKWWAMLLWRQ
jgi:hypothetical protein